ncbi:class I SAM-dependent methyltransferase [Melioribacter sp. Ez-97]|uniref:class I SAM-dependent methyltransferase n=1 Tax=Melioribacter sp. Ez-97 TaxID=3423434 RepID=UPI003ED9FF0D
MEIVKLNLGCGIYPEKGYINIDKDVSVKPDIVRDVTRGLPYSSNIVEEVRAYHFLEHLDPYDFLFIIEEVWRVLKPKGIFDIIVPMGITDDPTHRIFFNDNSFNVFLDRDSQYYYRRGSFWNLIKKEVVPQKYPSLHIILQKDEILK